MKKRWRISRRSRKRGRKKANHISGSAQAELFFLCKNIYQFQSVNIIRTQQTCSTCVCILCKYGMWTFGVDLPCTYVFAMTIWMKLSRGMQNTVAIDFKVLQRFIYEIIADMFVVYMWIHTNVNIDFVNERSNDKIGLKTVTQSNEAPRTYIITSQLG